MDNKVTDLLVTALREAFEQHQKEPHQYIVAYRRKNEDLLGYHADSFCSLAQDPLNAKRYAGEDPYGQLGTIWKNLTSVLKATPEQPGFLSIPLQVRNKFYENLTKDDIYIDAIYLAEGTPTQRFSATIINPTNNG